MEKEYKTFNDLVFSEPDKMNISRARMNFDNGYGVSVITGGFSYTSRVMPYEIAILKDNCLCYSTPLTDDVIGYQTEDDVTAIMKIVQDYERDDDNG